MIQKDLLQLFSEFISQCEYSKRLRPATIKGYKATFELLLKQVSEISSVDDLTPETMTEFFKRLETRKRTVGRNIIKTGVKNSTIKTYYLKLNAFFEWLVMKEYIKKNPLKDITPPQVRHDDYRRLEVEEIHKLYTAVISHSINPLLSRRDTMMISLLLYTGMRRGEFISLRMTDIDLEKKEITIRGETSKSKKTRVLKIHPTLALHLKDYIRERKLRGLKTSSLIVSNRGDRGLSRDGLEHWVKNLNKKSEVKFHLHRFRHTFVCILSEADVSIFKIQKMAGHADIRMTMKYARSLQTEDMAEDIAKISI